LKFDLIARVAIFPSVVVRSPLMNSLFEMVGVD